jgi:hypothetical protein
MDPADEASGVRKRLENLGHLPAAAVDPESEEILLRCAIEAFQRARGIDPTGELDDRTRQELLDAHGS